MGNIGAALILIFDLCLPYWRRREGGESPTGKLLGCVEKNRRAEEGKRKVEEMLVIWLLQ